MNAATANARRLAKDAQILLEHESWATAAAVAALSIEESGKVVILRRFVTADAEDLKALWKEYRTHTKKNLNWIVPDLTAAGARTLEDFRPTVAATSDHPQVLDSTKQLGFYTDCFAEGRWSSPDVAIDETLARGLVSAATILSPDRSITVRELELWREHMGPVWNQHITWMKRGLVNWYAAMQQEGLAPSGANKMQEFVVGGLTEQQAGKLGGGGEA